MSKLDSFIKKNTEIKDKLLEACFLQREETMEQVLFEIWQFRDKEARHHINTFDAINKLKSTLEQKHEERRK